MKSVIKEQDKLLLYQHAEVLSWDSASVIQSKKRLYLQERIRPDSPQLCEHHRPS